MSSWKFTLPFLDSRLLDVVLLFLTIWVVSKFWLLSNVMYICFFMQVFLLGVYLRVDLLGHRYVKLVNLGGKKITSLFSLTIMLNLAFPSIMNVGSKA